MDYTCRTRSLQSLAKDMKSGKISLSHKLQRPEGQWNKKTKTDLIDSLLRKYPINPTYGIKEDGTISIIDGVQRLSTIRDYLIDGFALSKDMKPIIINDIEYNLAGLKFSKLESDIQDVILNCELQVYELVDCTEEDVREMFRRQNAGKPLNNKQLRIVHESDIFSQSVYELANHEFMEKLVTNTQRKNGTDRDLIIQTLMLICTNQENDFTSFRSKDIDIFVRDCSDMTFAKIPVLKDAMDRYEEAFEDIRIPVTSIPMILYSGYRITKDKKSFSKLVEVVKSFVENYDSNEEYKAFVNRGTTDQENVRGRFNYWRNIIREL